MRTLLAVLISLSFSCASLGFSPERALPSVARLVINSQAWCQAFSINEGIWVTAAHCTPEGSTLHIGLTAVTVKEIHPSLDIAILEGPPAPALHLSREPPRVGDDVYVLVVSPTIAAIYFGRISRLEIASGLPDWPNSMLIQDGGGPGSSGAPILSEKGLVVSMVQGGYRQPYSPNLALGTPFTTLWDILRPYTPIPGAERAGEDATSSWPSPSHLGDDSFTLWTDVEGLSSSPRRVW